MTDADKYALAKSTYIAMVNAPHQSPEQRRLEKEYEPLKTLYPLGSENFFSPRNIDTVEKLTDFIWDCIKGLIKYRQIMNVGDCEWHHPSASHSSHIKDAWEAANLMGIRLPKEPDGKYSLAEELGLLREAIKVLEEKHAAPAAVISSREINSPIQLHSDALKCLRILSQSLVTMTIEDFAGRDGLPCDTKTVGVRLTELIGAGYAARKTKKSGIEITDAGRKLLE